MITDESADYDGGDVVIRGNGITLVYDIAPMASGVWSSVLVTLAPGAQWHLGFVGGSLATLADFQLALGSVTDFWITAEFHNGVSETTGLDNVQLATTAAAIPEPSSLVLLAAGAAALHGLRYRRARPAE